MDAAGIFMMQGLTPGMLWSMSRNQSLVCHQLKLTYTNTFSKCTLVERILNDSLKLCISSGTSGSAIQLTANFFRILSRPQWVLYQYHVDFKPPMESRRLRSALLFHHEEALGSARSFDGALLFLPHRLHSKVI